MQNIKRYNQIYLSGGGNEHQSFPLDKFFFAALLNGGRFLYIPIALRGHALYSRAALWMRGVLALHDRDDLRFELLDDLANKQLKDLKLFDAIYIGGGNTWGLMKEIKESGFSDLLIQYVESGGVIYGGSAGAIILGRRIDISDDTNIVKWPNNFGLRLLGNYSVACHYKIEEVDRFKARAMENSLPIICLPEDAGLIIEDTTARCVGSGNCVIYTTGGKMVTIVPDNTFKLE